MKARLYKAIHERIISTLHVLEKRLLCEKVIDIMYTGKDSPVVSENSCFRDVMEAMDIRSMGAVSVMDADYRLIK